MRRSHCKHRIVMPQSATPLLSAVFTPRRRTEPGPMGTHCFPRLLHASPRRFPDLNRGPFRGIPYISVIFAGFPPAHRLNYARMPSETAQRSCGRKEADELQRKSGAAGLTRTPDLVITNHPLCQLSYSSISAFSGPCPWLAPRRGELALAPERGRLLLKTKNYFSPSRAKPLPSPSACPKNRCLSACRGKPGAFRSGPPALRRK